MKWIKSRDKFLNEAKIREVILKKQAEKVKSKWGEKYLDYEEITPTDNIKQGKWKLSEDDKMKVLGAFFDSNIEETQKIFRTLPDKFTQILSKSINTDLLGEQKGKYDIILKDFNIKEPSIHQIVSIFDNIFRKLNINETIASEMISKDESGRPIRDESGQMVKIKKEAGDPIFSNNLVNINSWISDYNRCYPQNSIDEDTFKNRNISNIRNLALEDCNGEYETEFEIFGKDLYLSISHNPKDILNMSISKFYSSCQHLYSGGYNEKVLSNVFDPNSIPAFLLFETPIYLKDEKISDNLPLSRMVIRNIESFDSGKNDEPKIFFDRAYPDRMKDIFDEIIPKYSGNIQNIEKDDINYYLFTPDVDIDDDLNPPYMDRLSLKEGKYIGVNTKKLYLSKSSDWRTCKISPQAKIKELIIETTDLPDNIDKIPLNVDWVKFKFIKINTLNNFEKLRTSSFAFDKCKFDVSIIKEISEKNKLEKLQLTACDVSNFNLSFIKEIDELQLIYTLSKNEKLSQVIGDIKFKKLVISGDLVSDSDNKKWINSIKGRGIKVEIIGPVI